MKQILLIALATFTLSISGLWADEVAKSSEESACPQDKESVTQHTIQINGQPLSYRSVAGTLVLKDEKDKPKASIFYVAYYKEGEERLADRPLTFCFNGGPGAASVWLHLGAFGPRRVDYRDLASAAAPYRLQDNPYTLLDTTDLVFVDAVSTGFSRAAGSHEAKEFYGVDEDVQALSEFIRLFITRQNRWDSPKFLMGESYGTTRCAVLAHYLQRAKYIDVNGLVLISSALNWYTFHDENGGNDLPYVLYLPTYATTAWYHKRLNPELQSHRSQLVQEAERFAIEEYVLALMKGNQIDSALQLRIAEQLERLTGIDKAVWIECNLRMDPQLFARQLLRSQGEVLGRFDSRYSGKDPEALLEFKPYDPSFEAILGLFTATLNTYVRKELNWCADEEYFALKNVSPWNYRDGSSSCLNVAGDLQTALWRNPSMRVFFGSGEYDLAIPYFTTQYTIHHLRQIDLAKRVDSKRFAAGHMMFLNPESLQQLKQDLVQFYRETLRIR